VGTEDGLRTFNWIWQWTNIFC